MRYGGHGKVTSYNVTLFHAIRAKTRVIGARNNRGEK